MKKVLVSCGPIPGRLDSVKFITNRFKGGLSFKVANELSNEFDVTVLKWKYTTGPESILYKNTIDILDVQEYYEYIKNNALNYDTFILSAAVANIIPVNPWEGKFPSHLYKEGDVIDVKFTIAPRAIDIVKKINPKANLIGYKLFDGSREELLSAAKHTLRDSKANIVFANSPSDAKSKKIAITQSGAEIEMDFDQHVEFIRQSIVQEYYKTEIVEDVEYSEDMHPDIGNPFWAKKAIDLFMSEYEHGCLAVKQEDSFLISGRGHKHVSRVYEVDYANLTIKSNKKASSNAPLVSRLLESCDIVVHKHKYLDNVPEFDYCFPGTKKETDLDVSSGEFNIKNHGFIKGYKIMNVDWNSYYAVFPQKYFKVPDFILKEVENCSEILEVGCNSRPMEKSKYVIEPSMNVEGKINIDFNNIAENSFDLIVLNNSINYPRTEEIDLLIKSLKPGAKIIANSFVPRTNGKICGNEISIVGSDKILHLLFHKNICYQHWFYNRPIDFWKSKGFGIEKYGESSLKLEYVRKIL